MKLAEALIERSTLQKTLEQLRNRAVNGSQLQEGDDGIENMPKLFASIQDVVRKIEGLIKQINRTNFANGLSDQLAERDSLKKLRDMWMSFAHKASNREVRYGRNEVKFVAGIDVGQTHKQADAYAKAFRELDTAIQSKNWQIDLSE